VKVFATWSIPYHDYAAMPAVIRLDVEEVTMSTTDGAARTLPRHAPTKPPDWLRKVLFVCGPLSALVYIGWHEIAALQWEGYSRIFNAISELHLTGTPSKWMLDPWEGLVDNALLIAFGIGVWRSAQGSRALRAIGCLQILSGATFPLWLLFGEASLCAHLVLAVVGILTWLGSMGFGVAALGRRFRIYSLVSLAVVVTFNALALAYAPEVAAGQPTPWIGLCERIAFGAYFLWLSLLAVALWRRLAIKDRDEDLEHRAQATETI
jgi:glycerol-3-phosphate acyltransferase PlsY